MVWTHARGCTTCATLALLLAGTALAEDGKAGLNYRYYETRIGTVLDISDLTPAAEGTMPGFAMPDKARPEHYAVEWWGAVEVPAEGDYTFYTKSDDGSLLAVDDKLVVLNDYGHSDTEKSGKVHLAAGKHAVWAGYFQGGGDRSMSVSWEGPGIKKAAIPASALTQAPKAYRLPEGKPKTTTLEWPEIGQKFDVVVDTRAEPRLDPMQGAIPATILKNFPLMWSKLGTPITRMPKVVRFTVRHDINVPAYAAGSDIVFSAEHFTKHPDDLGCVIHELSHVVQSYRNIPDGTGWIVEGLADYTRYRCAVDHNGWGIQVPYRKGMKYTEGYGTAAGFFIWIEKDFDPDIAIKLNRALKYGNYTPKVWTTSTGKTLDELWEQYKTVPAPVPARPDAKR